MLGGFGARLRGIPVLVGGCALIAVLSAGSAFALCPAAPASGCKLSGGAKLAFHNAANDAKDQMFWRWGKGQVLSLSELGDPITHTEYTLCLYAGSAQALAAEFPVPISGGWKDLSSGGFAFSAPKGDGIRFVDMRPGESGKAGVAMKGKGRSLPDPALPLAPPVTVQMFADPESLCLTTQFAAEDAATNSPTRYKAQAKQYLPPPANTIPVQDACNKAGDDGGVAEQVGAQMRRSGTEWASSCIGYYGAQGSACNVSFPGDTPYLAVPDGIPSLVCPNTPDCDNSLGRVEWHAEDKFARKCTFDQWSLVWNWIQSRADQRATGSAPPDCDVSAAAPAFWGVYSCYEKYYVHPLMVNMLTKLRDYSPPLTPQCQGAVITRLWWRLASDWIRYGDDVCHDLYDDIEMQDSCGTHTASPMIDQPTVDAWCDEFSDFLRPVYEGVRAAAGKPY